MPKLLLQLLAVAAALVVTVAAAGTPSASSPSAPSPSPTRPVGAADPFKPDPSSTTWGETGLDPDPCWWPGYYSTDPDYPRGNRATHNDTFCMPTVPVTANYSSNLLKVTLSKETMHSGLCDPGRHADILFRTMSQNHLISNCVPELNDTSGCQGEFMYDCRYHDDQWGDIMGKDQVENCTMSISSEFQNGISPPMIQLMRSVIIGMFSSVSVNSTTGGLGSGARIEKFYKSGSRNDDRHFERNLTVFDAPSWIKLEVLTRGSPDPGSSGTLTAGLECKGPPLKPKSSCSLITGIIAAIAGILGGIAGGVGAVGAAAAAPGLLGGTSTFAGQFCGSG